MKSDGSEITGLTFRGKVPEGTDLSAVSYTHLFYLNGIVENVEAVANYSGR